MPGDQKVVHFPVPPRFWDNPGDVPSFRLWAAQFDNFVFSVNSQRTVAEKMMDEFKNRLLFSLLRTEGNLELRLHVRGPEHRHDYIRHLLCSHEEPLPADQQPDPRFLRFPVATSANG